LDISELVGIHSIGHGLTNVKVEFNNDLKLNVSDISIEGKKGEILNIPRWVADVLQSEKHVEIKDSETLVELKQAAMKEEVLENIKGQVPMQRLAMPEEIAKAVCYLASDDAAYITGETLALNGGLYMN